MCELVPQGADLDIPIHRIFKSQIMRVTDYKIAPQTEMLHVTHIIQPLWRIYEVGDFKIGRIINKVRFVDDMAILAKTQEELQDMVIGLVDTGRKYGMEINIDKSQIRPSWVQIFASGSCFQIPLAWIPPLM